jgi:hypothetical protein
MSTDKYLAPEGSARVGSDGHHGSHAARFLERFVDDAELTEVVRWHDEPSPPGWARSRAATPSVLKRARALVNRLGSALPLYLRFFRADNAIAGKSPRAVHWFEALAAEGDQGAVER